MRRYSIQIRMHKISLPCDFDATLDATVFMLFVQCMAARRHRIFGGKNVAFIIRLTLFRKPGDNTKSYSVSRSSD